MRRHFSIYNYFQLLKMADQRSKAKLEDTTAELNSGNSNPGNRTYQVFVKKNFAQEQNSIPNKAGLEKQEEIVIEGPLGEDDCGSVSCGKVKFQKKRIILVTVILTLLLAAIIVPIAVIFGRKAADVQESNTETSLIKFNKQAVPLGIVVYPNPTGVCCVMVFLLSTKVQITEPFTRTTAICSAATKTKELECEVTVPVLDIIDSIYSSEQKPSEKRWLNQFYQNTSSFLDTFQNVVKRIQVAQNLNGGEKINVVSVSQRTLIDVTYNNDESKFIVGRYDNSVNIQEEPTPTGQKTPTQNRPQDKSWILKILTKASSNLGKIIKNSFDVIKARSSELARQQKKLIEKRNFTGQWLDALVNQCVTVSHQLFRCTLDGVKKLVPDFKVQDLAQIPSDVRTTSTLLLKVKQSSA